MPARLPRWREFLAARGARALSRDPAWLLVLAEGMQHEPCCLEARAGGQIVGLLPLAFVHSLWFGRFLVSIPYLNTGGVAASEPEAAAALIDRAVALADSRDARYLELRHEEPVTHPAFRHTLTSKVHMRLGLPGSAEELWKRFKPKVRNQIRKGESHPLAVVWGGGELLGQFYAVFAHNMRDLGTPVFPGRLFRSVLDQFPGNAELCVVRSGSRPVAAGLLVHGRGVSEILSASSLRSHNPTNANMLMYWHLLQRAIDRQQAVFDFGRSTVGSSTYRFKKQWGATASPATWQYYLRAGSPADLRPEAGKYSCWIRVWKRLPVRVTRWLGPHISRGIP